MVDRRGVPLGLIPIGLVNRIASAASLSIDGVWITVVVSGNNRFASALSLSIDEVWITVVVSDEADSLTGSLGKSSLGRAGRGSCFLWAFGPADQFDNDRIADIT